MKLNGARFCLKTRWWDFPNVSHSGLANIYFFYLYAIEWYIVEIRTRWKFDSLPRGNHDSNQNNSTDHDVTLKIL